MIRGAFFDVGDTLVEQWAPPDDYHARQRAALILALGERDWYERWLAAEIEPKGEVGDLRQPTLEWYAGWFRTSGIDVAEDELEQLRVAMTVPLGEIATPVPGAFEALRWCRDRGLAVVLVTNTLSRGDAEVLIDWHRFELAEILTGVVSSHSVGWRKPHRAMFDRALEIAGCAPEEAFMVGDNLIADIDGAKRLGLRAIWRRTEDRTLDGYSGARPDAVIDDLTEIPRVVVPWLGASGPPTS